MNQFSGHRGCSTCAQARRATLDSEAGLWMNCRSLSGGSDPKFAGEALDGLTGVLVLGDPLGGALAGMHDRRVVAVAEGAADRRQADARELAREVHGDLARGGDG